MEVKETKDLQVMAGYYDIATRLAKSSLIPSSFKDPVNAWYAILYGANLGLSPIYSLSNIYVVDGRPTLAAEAMLAVCRRSPEYGGIETTSTEKSCRVEIRRNMANGVQDVGVGEFSIEDAKTANLINKDNWKKYPKRMMRARALAYACREAFGDLLSGTYAPEELADEETSKTEHPAFEVVGEEKPAGKMQLVNAVKECYDVMKGFSMTSTKKAEYDKKIAEASKNGELSTLERIAVELEKIKQEQEAKGKAAREAKKPEPTTEAEIVPETPADAEPSDSPEITLKKSIIVAFEKLSKTGVYNEYHLANSFKKQTGLTFYGTDWKEALLKSDMTIDKMNASLKYWENALAQIEKKGAAPQPEKAQPTLAEQAAAAIAHLTGEAKAEADGVLAEAAALADKGDMAGYELMIGHYTKEAE
jgi:hypothetical protein